MQREWICKIMHMHKKQIWNQNYKKQKFKVQSSVLCSLKLQIYFLPNIKHCRLII
jgi:hypothetical protein